MIGTKKMASGEGLGPGQRQIHIRLPADATGITVDREGRVHVVRGNGESRSAHGEPPNDKRERELEREKMRKRLTIVKPPEVRRFDSEL